MGPPLARGARPQGEHHGRRERLREPHAIQRQERPAALPHPGGRPAPAEEAGADFVLIPSGRRDMSRRHPDFRFRADRQGDGGATRPRTLQRRGAGRQPPVRHRAPGTPTSGRKFPADRRDQGDDGQLKALPVEIVECPIVRGRTGLALSRNTLLDEAHRAAAPHIRHAARHGRNHFEMTPAELRHGSRQKWSAIRCSRSSTTSRSTLTMQEVAAWSDSERIQGCIAPGRGDPFN